MKLIVAYIQPDALPSVKKSLFQKDIFKISVTNASGCGQQKGYAENYRGTITEVNLLKKIRIEIAVNDEYVDSVTNAIIDGARTGNIGDGKIFVMDLGDCIRIRTGESGSVAIG